ncbi:unnamed protein product [Polarella glacialis]|uniref:Acylaminoacyl-peptidase n=2 Tax=Polarella glacialis TaxID=89957 RepID=A0A813FPY0_POLGL|nr:unnamed protein product [Polarella glacialis]
MLMSASAGESPFESTPIWPSVEMPEVSVALKLEVPVRPELDHWTSPDLKVCAVKDVVCCGELVLLLLEGTASLLPQSRLALWRPTRCGSVQPEGKGHGGGSGMAQLRPVSLRGFPADPQACSQIWPGDSEQSCFGRCGDILWRLELGAAEEDKDSPLEVSASQIFVLPPHVVSMNCAVANQNQRRLPSEPASGSFFCAMLVRPAAPPAAPGRPLIVAPRQSLQQWPAAKLCVFEPSLGLRAVADIPRLSETLVVSSGCRQVCVWRAMLNEVPEEAERGEFLAWSSDDSLSGSPGKGKGNVACLTEGAGRVGVAAVSGNGEIILLQANFSADRPITTHMALVLVLWPLGEARPRSERRMLIQGQHIHAFGFCGGSGVSSCGTAGAGEAFYVTRLAGVDPETSVWAGPAAQQGLRLSHAILSRSAALARSQDSPDAQAIVYGTERADSLPELAIAWCQSDFKEAESAVQLHALPQPQGASSLVVEKIRYRHGSEWVTALLCERLEPPCNPCAPLLVHAHGGPAVGVVCSQRMAADHVRYPYRHLLMAGYRVLQPLFRGSLGFGDQWSSGNIGSQGNLKGDLGDILAGLDWLNEGHPRLKGTIDPARTAIFGGSYGGYMTIRAMSAVPERFAAGVALYGFVHNRWMTYEGGDFTWEDEYIVPAIPEECDFQIEMVEQEEDASPTPKDVEDSSPVGESAGSPRSAGSRLPRSRSRAWSESSQMSAAASDVWPLPREMEASDNFNGLHKICRPLLLMHGEKDDICPLSQSQVAFHMLEKQGVPTGLIVYPGEGHGFDDPEHQRDRDRRMLAWFHEHLPTGDLGEVPDYRQGMACDWGAQSGQLVQGTLFIGAPIVSVHGKCTNKPRRHLQDFAEAGLVPPAVHQMELHPLWHDDELLAFSAESGTHVQAYGCLGGAHTGAMLLRVPVMRKVAEREHMTVGQVLLRWVMQHSYSLISGGSSDAHLKENMNSLNLQVPQKDITWFDQWIPKENMQKSYGPHPEEII